MAAQQFDCAQHPEVIGQGVEEADGVLAVELRGPIWRGNRAAEAAGAASHDEHIEAALDA